MWLFVSLKRLTSTRTASVFADDYQEPEPERRAGDAQVHHAGRDHDLPRLAISTRKWVNHSVVGVYLAFFLSSTSPLSSADCRSNPVTPSAPAPSSRTFCRSFPARACRYIERREGFLEKEAHYSEFSSFFSWLVVSFFSPPQHVINPTVVPAVTCACSIQSRPQSRLPYYRISDYSVEHDRRGLDDREGAGGHRGEDSSGRLAQQGAGQALILTLQMLRMLVRTTPQGHVY